MSKVCRKCKRELPATIEFFSKSPKSKDRFRYWCRQCHVEYKQEWAKRNIGFREKRKEQRMLYNRKREGDNREFWRHYKWVHNKVRKLMPKPKYCTICNESKFMELANISGEYKEDIHDYIWLCKSCHRLFDRINKTHEVVVIG